MSENTNKLTKESEKQLGQYKYQTNWDSSRDELEQPLELVPQWIEDGSSDPMTQPEPTFISKHLKTLSAFSLGLLISLSTTYNKHKEPVSEPVAILPTSSLKRWEGYSEDPYKDSLGYLTIGYGTKLSSNRSLSVNDIDLTTSKQVANLLLTERVDNIYLELSTGTNSDIFNSMSDDIQEVLISMAYQLGTQGLYNFKRMWGHLANKNYSGASGEALNSLWAKQTPRRARHHANVIKQG